MTEQRSFDLRETTDRHGDRWEFDGSYLTRTEEATDGWPRTLRVLRQVLWGMLRNRQLHMHHGCHLGWAAQVDVARRHLRGRRLPLDTMGRERSRRAAE